MSGFNHQISPAPGLSIRQPAPVEPLEDAGAIMARFPQGCQLNITVVFPGEYRIGYKYLGFLYIPGIGSYYPLTEALELCWQVFQTNQAKGDHG